MHIKPFCLLFLLLVLLGGFCAHARAESPARPPAENAFPIAFKTINLDKSGMTADCGAEHKGEFVKRKLSFPQIESPASESENLWNSLLAQKAMEGFGGYVSNDCMDDDTTFTVTFASPQFISVDISDTMYGHGAAHGDWNGQQFSWWLKDKRQLGTSDVFSSDKDWRSFLYEKFLDHLEKARTDDQKDYELDERLTPQIKDIVLEPSRWEITPGFLGIHFYAYEFGSYAAGAPYIKIEWKELAPYLSQFGLSKNLNLKQ